MNEAVLKLLKLPPVASSKLLRTYGVENKITLMPEKGTLDLGLSRLIRSSHVLKLLPSKGARMPLGRYFERCVEVFLHAAYPGDTIYSNIKIKAPHVQGELDFVITSICKTIHLEVALKFFLYRPEDGILKLSHFHGPNLNDRLDLKLDKLITAQLRKTVPLDIRAPAGHLAVERSLWLSGVLYYPFKMFFENSLPDVSTIGINPFHEKSWWARPSEIFHQSAAGRHSEPCRHSERSEESPATSRKSPMIYEVYELSKDQWFKDWQNIESKIPFNKDLLKNLLEPIFVVAFDQDGNEMPRGFIVPENW